MEPARVPDGVYAASLTPQHDDGSVDYEALVAHARWLLNHGCDGIVLFGTTGEATSFSTAERMDALEALLLAGFPAGRLMVGTGCCAVPDTVLLTRHAVAHGACNVLMLPPFYYTHVRDDGLFAAFDQVIQQVGDAALRVYLYHFPQMTGVPFSDEVIRRLMQAHPGTLAGMKDSSGDWMHMKATIETFPGFQVFAGTERYLLDILLAGGAGCITATTNVTCPLAGAVYAGWTTDDVRHTQHRLTAVRAALEAFPFVPALKHLLAERTGQDAWRTLRPPLAPLTADEAAALRDALEQLNFAPEFA